MRPITTTRQGNEPTKLLRFGHKDMTRTRVAVVFLLGLTTLALYFCYVLVDPFRKPILFALIFAVVFDPARAKLRNWIRNRNGSAAFSTAAMILLVGAFSFFIGRALVSGLYDIYNSLAGSGESRERLTVFIIQLLDRAISWASHYVPISVPNAQSALLSQAEKAVARVLGAAAGFVGGLSAFVVNTLIRDFRDVLLASGRQVDGASFGHHAATTTRSSMVPV